MTPFEVATAAGLDLSVPQAAVLKAISGVTLGRDELREWRSLTGTGWPTKPRPEGYLRTGGDILAGRRSGKTSRIAAPIVVSAALQPCPNLAPGERPYCLITGPEIRHGVELLAMVKGLLAVLAIPFQERVTESLLELESGVRIQAIAASVIAARNKTALVCVVDEAAFLPSAEGADGQDSEVLSALRACLLTTNGALWLLSTPWLRKGEFFRAVESGHGKNGDRLCVRAATWQLNPSIALEQTRKLEPDERRWRREYAAQFIDAESAFIDRDSIRACVDVGVRERPPQAGVHYCAALDASSGVNEFVVAIAHAEVRSRPNAPPMHRVVIDTIRGFRGKLDYDAVADSISALLRAYRVSKVVGDNREASGLTALLKARGIALDVASMAPTQQTIRFEALAARLRTDGIRLLDDEQTVTQLAELRIEQLPSGQQRYGAPRRKGAADDRADVIALLVERAVSLVPCGDCEVVYEPRRQADGRYVGITASYWMLRRDWAGRVVERMPSAPPEGTPQAEHARRERLAQGMVTPDDERWLARQAELAGVSVQSIVERLTEQPTVQLVNPSQMRESAVTRVPVNVKVIGG